MFERISDLYIHIQYAVRSLLRDPAFAVVAIVILALGIGTSAAVFSVVNSVLVRPLAFRDPDQLIWVWSRRTDSNRAPFTLPDFLDFQMQNQSVEIAAFGNIGFSMSGAERTERVQGSRVSANLFQLLGVLPKVGRLMIPEDDRAEQRHVVVLTYECWQRRFAGDPRIVGKPLILNGESYDVIGILREDFLLPIPEAELAVPLAPEADPLRNIRNSVNFLHAIARLKPGVTRNQAESDLSGIVMRAKQLHGAPYLRKTGVSLVPLYEELVGQVRTPLLVLLGAVGFVLLIACSNLAALSLNRASRRYKEITIKKALGATSGRLMVQLLTESLILSLVGGVIGLGLAAWGVQALLSLSPIHLPRSQEIGLDLRVVGFVSCVCMLSAMAFGILPAWQGAKAEMGSVLRATVRGAGDAARQNRWRSILVIGEVSLSLILLVASALLIRSFIRVQAINPGFDASSTSAVRLSVPKTRYKDRASLVQFHEKLLPAIQNLPGVEEVGTVSQPPMSTGVSRVPFNIEGRASSSSDTYIAQFRMGSPGYFRAMKIPLRQGRPLDERDNEHSLPVGLINEEMARRLWPDGNPIGVRLTIHDNNTGPRPIEIVGVVGNVKHLGLESDPTLDIYIPMAQLHEDWVGIVSGSHYWIIRSNADSRSVETAFLRELRNVDQEVATSGMQTIEKYLSASVAPRRFNSQILSIFSVAALMLAITGLYGVVSYSVIQRTPEIGIRLALGAAPRQMFKLILVNGLKLVFVGLAIGLAGTLVLTKVMRSLLFGISPRDPQTIIFASLVLLLIALIASVIPALRAARVDPLSALRNE